MHVLFLAKSALFGCRVNTDDRLGRAGGRAGRGYSSDLADESAFVQEIGGPCFFDMLNGTVGNWLPV